MPLARPLWKLVRDQNLNGKVAPYQPPERASCHVWMILAARANPLRNSLSTTGPLCATILLMSSPHSPIKSALATLAAGTTADPLGIATPTPLAPTHGSTVQTAARRKVGQPPVEPVVAPVTSVTAMPLAPREENRGRHLHPDLPDDFHALRRSLFTLPNGKRIGVMAAARRAGISYATVLVLTMGRRRPMLDTGLRLAAALSITPTRLNEVLKKIRALRPDQPTRKELTTTISAAREELKRQARG